MSDSENEPDDQDPSIEEPGDTNSLDEDPVAEGEEPLAPKPKPSIKIASDVMFFTIAKALEDVWQAGQSKKRRIPDHQKLNRILPPVFFEKLKGHNPPESVFPIFRLLMPEKDGSRFWKMAENFIATTYTGALDLSKESLKAKKLLNYTDPNVVSAKEGRGDLSLVVEHVVSTTKLKKPSNWTIGDINDALDELCKLPDRAKSLRDSQHDWRGSDGKKKKKKPVLKDLRITWLKSLNMDRPKKLGLSPLEHKWLVRILLRKMQFNLGYKKVLNWYNPMGTTLFTAHSSLRAICDRLCDPEFENAQTDRKDTNADEVAGLDSYMRKSLAAPEFGKIFSPMVSEKTGFDRILDDISHRHRDYIASEEVRKLYSHVQKDSLAFMHPAFCVEPKLDGERMLIHVSRDGIVKMHTRNGNWYSELYSPSLGPPLRRALKKSFDVILDGEVIAWDSGRQETVPFGNNRTIANMRKAYFRSKGLLDKRDEGMHAEDKDTQVISSTFFRFNKSSEDAEMAGEECWLQLILFDVVYLDGPGAADFLSSIVSETIRPRPSGGPLIDLELIERKKILYSLIDPQKTEVEVIQTYVIRPNGKNVSGEKYFDVQNPLMECGHPLYTLDSLRITLDGSVEDLIELDVRRRHGKSDDQISHARAYTVQALFGTLVEQQRLEGLLFKDLSAPYFLGEQSRGLRYWHKFKPDYFNGSVASDLDVIIIGGYYATGLRNAGKPSGALCACVDSEDPESFFPLVKVNLGSVDRKTLAQFLKETGYQKDQDDGDNDYENKWFRLDKDSREMPEFVSKKSSPSDTENRGWNAPKKDYPDIWIHPKDSCVITVNAGEIVDSDTFSAGLTLRFPRITKFRFGADRKKPSDIESERSLWNTFREVNENRSSFGSQTFSMGSPTIMTSGDRPLRFLTEKLYQESKKNRRRAKTSKQLLRVAVPEVSTVASKSLSGVVFAVLGGSFRLVDGSIDAQEAHEQGWLEEGLSVKDAQSIIKFIKKHGGTYKISADETCTFVLGGQPEDAKVRTYIRAIENAAAQIQPGKKAVTLKAKQQAKMSQLPGVLRWTFVYGLVHRWLSKHPFNNLSIKETEPELLHPTLLDYLARPATSGGTSTIDPAIFDIDLSSISAMRRALNSVGKSESSCRDRGTWREVCLTRLPPEERWVVSCGLQTFWPYYKDQEPDPKCIVYPDIFDGGHVGLSELREDHDANNDTRWNDVSSGIQASKVSSVLPLARAMGAFIHPHLHAGVTHVLCHLRDDFEEIEYSANLSTNVFLDASRGRKILDRLKEIGSSGNHMILLISPRWLRKRKWAN